MGPTMEPLFQMYLTGGGQQGLQSCLRARHTLIVGDGKRQDGHNEPPSGEVVHQERNKAIGIERSHHVSDLCVGRGRDKARVDSHRECDRKEGRAEGQSSEKAK